MSAATELSASAKEPTPDQPRVTAEKPTKEAVQLQAATAGPKNRKSKGTLARGPTAMPKSRGTGFEEYYAEPPLTAEEYEEEMDLYNPKIPFHERIETCLQRYRARRRLDNERSLLLNRYLSIGGIDCQPRQFNGTADLQRSNADNDLSKSDARTLSSTDIVTRGGTKNSKYYTPDHADLWTVDFPGVVSGYLSLSLPTLAANSEKRLTVGIDVVDNFLRYLQIHDVCLEYAEDIKKARAICAKARVELINCFDGRLYMPGQFNLACVRLFYNEPAHMAFNDGIDPRDNNLTPDAFLAQRIYEVATEPLRRHHGYESAHIVATKEADLEITHLNVVKTPQATEYDNVMEHPFEMAIAKHCIIEEGYANQPHPSAAKLKAQGNVSFFVDKELTELLHVGTKLRVVYHRLNYGVTFISSVKDVLPTFYTFLPQELMMEWKEPRLNEREAPSVTNPDADADEEAAQNAVDE